MPTDKENEAFLDCLLVAPLGLKLKIIVLMLITGCFPITLKWLNDAKGQKEREAEEQKRAKPWFERLAYPVTDPHYRIKLLEAGKCPQCGTDLDTGWECTDYLECGFIAYPERRRNQADAN